MSSTSESTVGSTTERTGVQDDSGTSEKSDLDSVNKIDTNTQTIGQVHINMHHNRWVWGKIRWVCFFFDLISSYFDTFVIS